MRFLLVHHGDVAEGAPEQAGSAGDDRRLSAVGLRQARAVAAELNALAAAGWRFQAVLSSPEACAQEAAKLVAEALALAHEVRRELSLGSGLSHSLTGWMQAAGGFADPDGILPLQESAWSVVEEFRKAEAEEGDVVVVTHELAIRALVCRALSMGLEDMRRFALYPGSISTIEFRRQPRERTLLASLNETCHLEPE